MSACNVGAAVPAAPPEAHSDRLQIGRRGLALLATFEVETDLLTLIEASQTSALDRRDMDENIFRTIIRLNEAVSLLGIEPLDRAFRHRVFLHAIRRSTPRGPECFSYWEHRSATRSHRQGTGNPR